MISDYKLQPVYGSMLHFTHSATLQALKQSFSSRCLCGPLFQVIANSASTVLLGTRTIHRPPTPGANAYHMPGQQGMRCYSDDCSHSSYVAFGS